MAAWSLLGLAIALSLDGFGAGVAYGIKRIRVPLGSLFVICLCSALAMALALLAGRGLTVLIPGEWAGRLGGGILILLGLFQLFNVAREDRSQENLGSGAEATATAPAIAMAVGETLEVKAEEVLSITLRPFGLVIQVLREPTQADLDHSGELGPQEALLLGLALNMDAIAAGFGASMVGALPLYAPPVVALTQLVFVCSGLYFGRMQARWAGGTWLAYGAGLVLMGLGFAKIIS
ncbi:sporulation membrane protein YtaF [Heliobacterium undosum]|uniref:Sporulation membrane protein YtaF n=1 Tax=Heliomicrobium undosum TaxID=121734 RepID=A0A845L5D2_9FIRM|nr:manganese efflux pump [Heliomicrobium undosum]MZP29870.1 sporulation membrane protein YtaF [Heliomicrobium undosum]